MPSRASPASTPGAAGAIYTYGGDREVQAAAAEGKEITNPILEMISPPVDDPEAIFAAAAQVRTRLAG